LAEELRLAGLLALLVEDEALVAIVTEDMLRDAGCAEVWPVASVSAALELLKQKQPHIALVDVNLGGDTSYTIAEELERLQIPFALATGYGRESLPPRWQHVPIVPKPYTRDILEMQMERALSKSVR
jgi:CheY-like chemotaxis protein